MMYSPRTESRRRRTLATALAGAVALVLAGCQVGTAYDPSGLDNRSGPDAETPLGPDATLPDPDAAPTPDAGPTCTNTCTLGASTCATSGNGTQVCIMGASGCTEWSAVEACGSSQTCNQGECQCAGTPCTPGEVRCGPTGGTESCQGPDPDGCTAWGPEAPCSAGLVCSSYNNECMPDTPTGCFPLNECDYVGQITCTSSISYRECVAAPDGCLEWDCAS